MCVHLYQYELLLSFSKWLFARVLICQSKGITAKVYKRLKPPNFAVKYISTTRIRAVMSIKDHG